MAVRKPLIVVSGTLQELSAADTLQVPGALSVVGSITQTVGAGNSFTTGGNISVRSPDGAEGGQISLYDKTNTTIYGNVDVDSGTTFRIFTATTGVRTILGQLAGTGGSVGIFTDSIERFRVNHSGWSADLGTTNLGNTSAEADLYIGPQANAGYLYGNAVAIGFYAGTSGGHFSVSKDAANRSILLDTGSLSGSSIVYNAQYNNFQSNSAETLLSIHNVNTTATTTKTGILRFYGRDTVNASKESVSISSIPADADYISSNLVFYTRVSDTMAERMRINSLGSVVIGANSTANLNFKAGTAGTTGSLNWTFNTDSTIYGSLSLPYDTRASVGLKLESVASYPITINSGNGTNFQEDGVTRVAISNSGTLTVYDSTSAARGYLFGTSTGGIFRLTTPGQGTTFEIKTGVTAEDTSIQHVGGSGNLLLGFTTGTSGYISFLQAGGTEAARLTSAGVFSLKQQLELTVPASVIAAATDTVEIFAKRFGPSGSRVMPAAVGPSGMDYTLQPSIWRQKISRWNPPGNSTSVPGIDGFGTFTAGGTATSRNVAVTNSLTRAKRLAYVSATTAGSYGGHYLNQAQFTVGNGSNVGGFFYSCRFGISDAVIQAVARTFVGLSSNTAAPTNVDPATLTNSVGIGHKENDTNLFIYYGGSAAQTRIDLGANFPVNLTELYDITLWSPPNANSVIYYYVERIGTSFTASGTLSGTPGTTTPANTTLLAHRAWRNNNTAAAAVALDISSVYTETDW